MKQVCIYVDNVDDVNGPQYVSEYYRRAYSYLYQYLHKQQAQVVIVHNEDASYQGNGTFLWYWQPSFDEDGIIHSYQKVEKPITVSFVFDKARFQATDVMVINPKKLTNICIDKFKTFQFIPDMHPKTYLVNTKSILKNKLEEFHDDENVVIKSVDSDGGEEVFIGKKSNFKDTFTYPLVVQDFIDGSAGVPGLCEGPHDLRVAVFDGEALYGRLRLPPRGGLISNISFGGEEKILNTAELPDVLIELVSTIDKRFNLGTQHRYYAVDFILSGNRWQVLEMNAWPGFLDPALGEESKLAIEKLAYKLISV